MFVSVTLNSSGAFFFSRGLVLVQSSGREPFCYFAHVFVICQSIFKPHVFVTFMMVGIVNDYDMDFCRSASGDATEKTSVDQQKVSHGDLPVGEEKKQDQTQVTYKTCS